MAVPAHDERDYAFARKFSIPIVPVIDGGDIDKDKVVEEGKYPIYANALSGDGIVGYYNDYYRVKAPAITVTGRGEVGHAQARMSDFTPVVRLLAIRSRHDCYFLENAINNHKVVVESTGVPQLTVPQLSSYDICFPSDIGEEVKIGEYFHKLDTLITLHQRKCEETKTLKKYMLQKMFPQNGRKVPEIRFVGYTDNWKQCKLSEISETFEYGLNVAAKKFDGKNKYIRITDIDDISHEFILDNVTSPDTDLTNAENYKLEEGDILFARTGASVGKTYMYRNSDGLVYYAGFLIRAKINKSINHEFIFQNTLTKDYKKYITITSQRSGQPGVNAQEYSEYRVMIPNRDEQDKISVYLRNLDNIVSLNQRKCDYFKEVKKYMLKNMFPQKG